MESATKPRILLTGATGFVGVHTSWELAERGYRLRCLVRKTSDTSRLPPDVELVAGHLLDFESLKSAVKDCWGVMHIGGIVRARNLREFYHINRDGTANLVRAASEGGVERFLLVSSQAAGGPSTLEHRKSADEPGNPITDYGKSKLAGEQVLMSRAGNMWWSIIRPPAVYGPWDYAFLTMVRWAQWGLKLRLGNGKMPFAIIHAADLARALALGLSANHPSGSIWYATDGTDHTMIEMADIIQEILRKKAIWVAVPIWISSPIALFIEFISNLRGQTALLSRQKILELTQEAWTCDDEPFRRATGFTHQFDLHKGLANTIEWYREQEWI